MRYLPLSIVLSAAASIAGAQVLSPRMGITAGVNQSRIAGTAVDVSNHTGAAVGAYLVVPSASGWSIQAGAIWTQKGWKREEPGTRDLSVVDLTYLQLPLLARYDFAPAGRFGAMVFGGPGLGFRSGCALSATPQSTGRTSTVTCAEAEDLSGGSIKFESFDIAAILGGGVRVAASRVNVVATAQYDFGLKRIATSGDNKNRTMTAALAFEFPLRRR